VPADVGRGIAGSGVQRFFFHLSNNGDTLRDARGIDLADAAAARNMALLAGSMLLERLGVMVSITDAAGHLIHGAPLEQAPAEAVDPMSGADAPRAPAAVPLAAVGDAGAPRAVGLHDRQVFQAILDAMLVDAANRQAKVALLIVDMDRFRELKTVYGAGKAEQVLQAVGERLVGAAGKGDLVARIGDDQFAVVMPNLTDISVASAVARDVCSWPDQTRNAALAGFSVSAGLASFPDDGHTAQDLMQAAELALGRAKSPGGSVVLFTRGLRTNLERRRHAIEQVAMALEEDRIRPAYQPKVSLLTGRTVGFEALLRWKHPSRGWQLPGTIMQAIEDRELGQAISERIWHHVLADARRWQDEGVQVGSIAVNVSPTELRQGYAEALLRRLGGAGLVPETIEIEITERSVIGADAGVVAAELGLLSAAGMRIALDDFGTGYGSLVHLQQLPVNALKIDRAFTMDLGPGANSAVIVHNLIRLCHSLRMDVVAEGVESQGQARFLRDEGCLVAQGFLFSKAAPADAVPRLAARAWQVPA